MKILIAYYSRTNVTKGIAEKLQKKLNCDIEEINDLGKHKGPIGWLKGGYEASQVKGCKIGATEKNPKDYDLVLIGTPVWASKLSSPMYEYVNQFKNDFNEVACFSTCMNRGEDGTYQHLEEVTGKTLKATLSFNKETIDNPDSKIDEFIEKVKK